MALGLIFTGPVMSASADDQPITEGVASSESTNSSEAVSEKTTSSTTETPAVPDSTGIGEVQDSTAQPTETTLNSPVTDSSETTKPQNTSVKTERPIGTVLWEITSTTDDVFLTPQKYVTEIASDNVNAWNSDSSLKCGTKYQADAYYADQIAALKDDGVLKGGEDNGIALHWNVFTTPSCPVVVPPGAPNPGAVQVVSCGQDIVTVNNDLSGAKDRLTASFVVYDNGKFLDALVALAGKPTVQSYTFPEDSGVHLITVRTGPAQGDVLLDSKAVVSDCVQSPVVVTPVVTPPTVDTPVTPVVDVTPVAPVKTVAKVNAEGLAYTGSDPLQLLFGGGVLFILGIIAFGVARKRSRA